ncbi:hypothetical protein Hypma_014646 [Hypsizygus marmoreus]|uniref:Uncharacterized protein n=1 Tax=Hypsizygus marmoreus TaxID=39966 RepID=A0A369JBM9_HYPMA|nr:hypothetical protein Hypma_014646 [Hypsizygus marmoreus]
MDLNQPQTREGDDGNGAQGDDLDSVHDDAVGTAALEGDIDGAPQGTSGDDDDGADFDNDWVWEDRNTMSEDEEDGGGEVGDIDIEELELHKMYGATRDRDPYSYD